MGVTVVYVHKIPKGLCGMEALEAFTKRILSMGARSDGNFFVDCIAYREYHPRIIYVLHNSEYPESTFSILYTGAGKKVPLVADTMFDVLVKVICPTSNINKTHVAGPRYKYGDFVIKLGLATVKNLSIILIEIEYPPCVFFSQGWQMIRSVLEDVLGTAVPQEYPAYFTPKPGENGKDEEPKMYEPMDTMMQYLLHFTN